MSLLAKKQYLMAILDRYKKSKKKEKGQILDEFCAVCGYSRKYAIRILNAEIEVPAGKAGRKAKYSQEAILALRDIWLLTGKICSKRLREAIPEWIDWYLEHSKSKNISEIKSIIKMSISTIDRKLKQFRDAIRKGKSTTRKSAWFRAHIPIRADNTGIDKPGFVQSDTVAHCGTRIEGEYAHTVTTTDILTTWTENRAIWRKCGNQVVDVFKNVEKRFPFPFFIIKTDSGTEFMNDKVYTFLTCREFPVDLVRSRPYQKNDNCYVEQKNFTHVRSAFGYHRLDGRSTPNNSSRLQIPIERLSRSSRSGICSADKFRLI